MIKQLLLRLDKLFDKVYKNLDKINDSHIIIE